MEIERLDKGGVSFVAQNGGVGAVEITFMDTDNQEKANKWLMEFLELIKKGDYELDLK